MIENEFELNGKRYVAKYFAVDGIAACDGCAFNNDDPCKFFMFCCSYMREDGRAVIFVEVPKPEPKTNADRIREMSNEELAGFLSDITDCVICPIHDFCKANKYEICCKAMLHWINSSVEEESENQ